MMYLDEPDDGPACPICDGYVEWEDCWQCHGEGGFHDCGEDTCCCLDKEELHIECGECKGSGGYFVCQSLPHSQGSEEVMDVDDAILLAIEDEASKRLALFRQQAGEVEMLAMPTDDVFIRGYVFGFLKASKQWKVSELSE